MEAITTRRFEGLATARTEIFSRSSAGSIEVVVGAGLYHVDPAVTGRLGIH